MGPPERTDLPHAAPGAAEHEHAPPADAPQAPQAPVGVAARTRTRRWPTLELLALGLVLAILLKPRLSEMFSDPAIQTWSTIFVSISLQALPFLVLGVTLSGAIAAFVPARFLARALPRKTALAVPAAGLSGMLLPGCECGSVPIAGRLVSRGVVPAAALTFLLSAPAINPIVLVSTAVAFPGQPQMVLARFLASLATAVIVGLLWARFGKEAWTSMARRRVMHGATKWRTFRDTAQHDFLHAGGFLVVGAAAAATMQVVVPRSILETVGGHGVAGVLTLALLAVLLSVCSEADAFVAASLAQFSNTAKLAFLVVGPAVDLKLIALQAGVFGRSFAMRFAPLAFGVALLAAVVAGWAFL